MNNGLQKDRKRLGKYSISEVFDHIDASPKHGQRINFYGNMMDMRSVRLMCFRLHGVACCVCGTKGAFFAKEYFKGDETHLNLYGYSKSGTEMLMTRDHIKPKSKGGTNHIYNLQTMCYNCNQDKSNTWTIKEKIKYYFRRTKYFFSKPL